MAKIYVVNQLKLCRNVGTINQLLETLKCRAAVRTLLSYGSSHEYENSYLKDVCFSFLNKRLVVEYEALSVVMGKISIS